MGSSPTTGTKNPERDSVRDFYLLPFHYSLFLHRGPEYNAPAPSGMGACRPTAKAAGGVPCTQKLAGRCGHRPLRSGTIEPGGNRDPARAAIQAAPTANRRRVRRGGLYIRPYTPPRWMHHRRTHSVGAIEPRRESGPGSGCESRTQALTGGYAGHTCLGSHSRHYLPLRFLYRADAEKQIFDSRLIDLCDDLKIRLPPFFSPTAEEKDIHTISEQHNTTWFGTACVIPFGMYVGIRSKAMTVGIYRSNKLVCSY